ERLGAADRRAGEDLHLAPARRGAVAGAIRGGPLCCFGRVRGAGGSVGRGQVHPDALLVRQLRRGGRAHPHPAPGRDRGPHSGRRAAGARGAAGDVGPRQPVPPRDPARAVARHRGGAAGGARDGAGRGQGGGTGAALALEHAPRPARAAPGDLLRWRAAAGEPGAGLRAGLPRAAAGRADREPRRRQPRRGRGVDPRSQGGGGGRGWHLPRHGRARPRRRPPVHRRAPTGGEPERRM
ncbi:MAG: Alpha-D-ribose 1-methylphosphonate 5-triphosphate synthase subunit PhnL, partial [uncultured Acetobacteraceae bacterium]